MTETQTSTVLRAAEQASAEDEHLIGLASK